MRLGLRGLRLGCDGFGGGGGDEPTLTARYWLIEQISSDNSPDLSAAALHFTDSGGATIVPTSWETLFPLGGTGSGPNAGDTVITNLFDDNAATSSLWTTATENGEGKIWYDFGGDVSPANLRVQAVAFPGDVHRTPNSLVIYNSSDGVTYTRVMEHSTYPYTTGNEARTFSLVVNANDPWPNTRFTNLAQRAIRSEDDMTWTLTAEGGFGVEHAVRVLPALADGGYVQWRQTYSMPDVNYGYAGMAVTPTGSGSTIRFGATRDVTFNISVLKMNANYTYSSHPYKANTYWGQEWFRVQRSGTSLLFRISADGVTWNTVHTETNFNPRCIGPYIENSGTVKLAGTEITVTYSDFTVS